MKKIGIIISAVAIIGLISISSAILIPNIMENNLNEDNTENSDMLKATVFDDSTDNPDPNQPTKNNANTENSDISKDTIKDNTLMQEYEKFIESGHIAVSSGEDLKLGKPLVLSYIDGELTAGFIDESTIGEGKQLKYTDGRPVGESTPPKYEDSR